MADGRFPPSSVPSLPSGASSPARSQGEITSMDLNSSSWKDLFPSVNAKLASLKRKKPYKWNLIVWTAQNECGGSVGLTAKSRNWTPFLNVGDCSLKNANSAFPILQTFKAKIKGHFPTLTIIVSGRVYWAHNMQCLKLINQGGFIPDKSAQIAADMGLTRQELLPEFIMAQTF